LADWLQRLRRAQGLAPAPVLPVPMGLLKALGHLIWPWQPLLHPECLHMLAAGSVADVAPLAQHLGRMPVAVPVPWPPEPARCRPLAGSEHDVEVQA
jgi:hypothetical protein